MRGPYKRAAVADVGSQTLGLALLENCSASNTMPQASTLRRLQLLERGPSSTPGVVGGASAVQQDDPPLAATVAPVRARTASSQRDPRPIRAHEELAARLQIVAARRASGYKSRSISPVEVAMRASLRGDVARYPTT